MKKPEKTGAKFVRSYAWKTGFLSTENKYGKVLQKPHGFGSVWVIGYMGTVFEQHYTIGELATLWHWHPDTVRSWFLEEPGCQIVKHPETMHKRGYTSLRVPKSVAERVYARRRSR